MGRVVDRALELAEEKFVAGSGPGGQNVNKVATTVQLRVDVFALGLPPDAFERLRDVAGSKVTKGGDRLADEDDVLSYFLEQGNVAMVGGAGFGMSPYMRISYAASDAELSEAADRIEALIAELS